MALRRAPEVPVRYIGDVIDTGAWAEIVRPAAARTRSGSDARIDQHDRRQLRRISLPQRPHRDGALRYTGLDQNSPDLGDRFPEGAIATGAGWNTDLDAAVRIALPIVRKGTDIGALGERKAGQPIADE